MPEAWVYILRCRDGSLYTGWTVDVPRRLAQHSAGKASRYTRARLPIELAASFPMATAQAARQQEARIKRMRRAQKLRLMQSAADIPVSAKGAAAVTARGRKESGNREAIASAPH